MAILFRLHNVVLIFKVHNKSYFTVKLGYVILSVELATKICKSPLYLVLNHQFDFNA